MASFNSYVSLPEGTRCLLVQPQSSARNPVHGQRSQIAIYPGGTLLSPSDMEELYDKGRAFFSAGYLRTFFGHANPSCGSQFSYQFSMSELNRPNVIRPSSQIDLKLGKKDFVLSKPMGFWGTSQF